jgi:hypothetical protein
MSDKSKRNPRVQDAGSWKDSLNEQAKIVAGIAKKLDFYRDARRDPPESMSKALHEQEALLDNSVKKLLASRDNLKADVLSDDRFDQHVLREIEISYQKAVCFAPGVERKHSRLFLLPCVYFRHEDGRIDSVIDFDEEKGQTLADFLVAFLDEHFGEDQSLGSPHVKLYSKSLRDWNVQDAEEKMLPALHAALLSGSALDLAKAFPARASTLQFPGAGWAVAVLPFAVEHDDEGWLESISFDGYDDDFTEEFEEIFDPSSKMDYAVPCDPTVMQDEAVRHLWNKQLELTVDDMIVSKKAKHFCAIETTFMWEDGEFAGVVMDFKIFDPDVAADENMENVIYHKQLSRQSLIGESPGQLSAFLVEYPPVMREDFDVVFGHQNQTAQG